MNLNKDHPLLINNNKKYNVLICERSDCQEYWNNIEYFVGPIKIYTCGWEKRITLSTTHKWKDFLDETFTTAQKAWEINDEIKVIKEDNDIQFYDMHSLKIHIYYDINVISLYLENHISLA